MIHRCCTKIQANRKSQQRSEGDWMPLVFQVLKFYAVSSSFPYRVTGALTNLRHLVGGEESVDGRPLPGPVQLCNPMDLARPTVLAENRSSQPRGEPHISMSPSVQKCMGHPDCPRFPKVQALAVVAISWCHCQLSLVWRKGEQ
jgi:hypothetical protein